MLWCKTVQIPRRSIMLMTEEKTKKIRERWKTEGHKLPGGVGPLGRRLSLTARGIDADPRAAAAQQLPERLAGELAHQVP